MYILLSSIIPILLSICDGTYGCHARNRNLPMVVSVQPQFKYVSWDEEFQIPCNGKGPPPIKLVKWYYHGISQASATPAVKGIWNAPLDSPSLKLLPQKSEARRLHVVRYDVQCIVSNENGHSASSITLIYIKRPPDRPIVLSIIPLRQGASINWRLGFNGYDNRYQSCYLNLIPGNTIKLEVYHTAITKYLSGLEALQEYTFEIQCRNSIGPSPWSRKGTFTTKEGYPDAAPEFIHAVPLNSTALNITWSPIPQKNIHGILTVYSVKVILEAENTRIQRIKNVTSGKEHQIFTKLKPGIQYYVQVAGYTRVKQGPWSGCVEVMMPQPKPPNTPIILTSSYVNVTMISPKPPSTPIILTSHHVEVTMPSPQPSSMPIMQICILVIGLLYVIITFIIILFISCRRKKSTKHQAGDPSVKYIPGNEEDDQTPLALPSSVRDKLLDVKISRERIQTPFALPSSVRDKLLDVKISRERIQLFQLLGEGEFGCVYRAILKSADGREGSGERTVAVKTMKTDEFNASEREEFVEEGLRMKNLDHPNVMALIGICLPEEKRNSNDYHGQISLSRDESISPFVIIPFMKMGDLKKHLSLARSSKETGSLTLHRLLNFALDITSGMEYLSQKNIIHRDLACRNCMLDSQFHVVVSDFGLSRQLYSSNYYRLNHEAKIPVKWLALESLTDGIYTSKTDIWSFGVTFWEIFTFCQSPYPGVTNRKMHEQLSRGIRLQKPPRCPNNVWFDSIFPCWNSKPDERPTFQDLILMLENFLQEYPEDHNPGPTNSATEYVNVLPPSEYEIQISPLLKYDEEPMPYEFAIEKNMSTK